MRRWYVFAFLGFVVHAQPCTVDGEILRKWPLANGDFSTFVVSGAPEENFLATGHEPTYRKYLDRCLPARWKPEIVSGEHAFHKAEAAPLTPADLPYHVFAKLNQPSAAVIQTTRAGTACFSQDVSLMPGEYRLTVAVSGTSGAKTFVSFTSGGVEISGAPVDLGSAEVELHLDVTSPGGPSSVRIGATAAAGQVVTFHRVELGIERLETTTIPFDGGSKLGGIVLPSRPTLAEEYAAYELQWYLFRMTGRVPGIKGRDRTHGGTKILLGRAVSRGVLESLRGLPDDAYLVRAAGRKIFLAGRTDQATLYAAYDFLKQQGCRWIVPGEDGETVPVRSALQRAAEKIEAPDFDCRGYHVLPMDHFLGPNGEEGWVSIDLDEYLDWSLRNRMNGIRFSGIKSYDFGAHRGHGWIQISNHSFNSMIASHEKYFEEHPEWYPLVKGKRVPKSHLPPGFPNQLCISNQELRNYTVNLAIELFETNPEMRMFPLIPMDGPSLWCECEGCKALDPPGIDWSKHADTGDVVGMTDRYVNYANEVASRVAEVLPEKRILIQAYSYTIRPPKHEKPHSNVIVRYANLSRPGQGPLGESILEKSVPMWDTWRDQLDGWRAAGAKMSHYNYMDWVNADASLFWYFTLSDVTRTLHRKYEFRQLFGETEPNQRVSVLMFQILAETLWDVDTDYRDVIREVCRHFYGPVAEEMIEYNLVMDRAIIDSDAWKNWKQVEGQLWGEGWRSNQHQEIPLPVLEEGRMLLERLASRVKKDPVLAKRIARARLGHAYLTYLRANVDPHPTIETKAVARQAFDLIHSLWMNDGVIIKRFSAEKLRKFSYPAIEGDDIDRE